jgi:phage terminase large subunit
MTSTTELERIARIQVPRQFRELFNPQWRNIVYYGGRASLKSHSVARSLLIRGSEKKLRILCTRELQKSIKDSVHKLLSDLIAEYELTDYLVLKDSITNTKTGTEFIFLGLRLNVLEIKSLEGIDICWVEEAHAITEASIDVLTPTIRKEGSQIIWTFNRLNELDPVYVKYVMHAPPNTYSRKVNYDIAERLGWLPDVLRVEMEADRQNPMLFAHKWLGEPLGQAEMSIIGRDTILAAMRREEPLEAVGVDEVGVDVARMGNDRIVFWRRKGLKTTNTKTFNKMRIPAICDALEQFVDFDKEILIKVDDTGVGGGVTDEMMKRGYNVMAINFGGEPVDKDKYPNWISEAWFYMGEVMPDIELPFDSDLLMELSTRQWKQDTRGRRAVESKQDYKKRGFRSPDLADACIICYYTPVLPQIEWPGVR